MSDLAGNFYNAWSEVFQKPEKRLYCSWHVDKSWRRKVAELIPSQQLQAHIYAVLKTLQFETNEPKFRKLLQDFLTFLTDEAPVFLEYFHTFYVQNDKTALWATCIGTVANTNMFAESFHRVLKKCLFQQETKQTCRQLASCSAETGKGQNSGAFN
ncbi:hypothetical protein BaRGS_00033815 [Batillaria attramentaria]|uniref:MULE transposase domain-containing protein n=1 Tax=Batillaria attramentaria TaxID=370345 RepID=A0ABD0JJJ4_9CAEN